MVCSPQSKCLYFKDSQKIYNSTQHINFSDKQKYPEFYKVEK